MYNTIRTIAFGAALIAGTCIANAGGHSGWKVNSDESTVYFGSVKKDKVGEVHSFSGISGMVASDGTAVIEIDLATVDSNIKIRDTRFKRHVFNEMGPAKLMAKLDMDALNAIGVGATGSVDVKGTLSLGAVELPIETSFFVIHLSEGKVIASTQSMIMLSIDKAGLTAGIDKLMELAKLPSITRVSPVTIRLMLEK